ncbi:serine/threonine-protein kinase [Streptomyces sp. NWU49]|uniref:serine/threonine-protein kinase n=1 Tax=Streptomyces sp. NWU49 TaxID=2201153 RepID=UPI00267F650B
MRGLGAGPAEAPAAVHERGLVHRDVKPSNVLLTLDGPLLIDFGIARAPDGTASLTSTGVSIGSPGCMPPEQVLGEGVTGAADVFSPGAVPAYAATGRPPFSGDTSAALLYKVVHEEPEPEGLDGEVRAGGGVPEQGPGRTADPGRGVPAACPRGRRPDDGRRVAAGALAERVSRAAVQLLNLEAGEGSPGPASGPVDFSRRSGRPRRRMRRPARRPKARLSKVGRGLHRPRSPVPPGDAYRPARRRCSRSPPLRTSGRGAGRERAGAAGGFGRSREPAHRSR